ncbi:MAG: HAMP domain-containing histidine kinase [Clostridiales bacterium]|nr:HAMP domain-containing histidine kinase [Clostridiales bacterium]
MKPRLRTKVSLAFAVCIIGCMCFLTLVSGLLLKPVFVWQSRTRMIHYGTQISELLEQGEGETQELLSSIYDSYLIHITIITDGDIITSTTEYLNGKAERIKDSPRLNNILQEFQAQEENPYLIERYNEGDQLRRLYYVRDLGDGTYIIMNKGIKGIEQSVQLVSLFLLCSAGVTALLGMVAWNLLTRRYTNQIEEISRVTRDMANLNFSQKVHYQGHDEIAVLADSVNDLSTKLEKSICDMQRELERRRELLRSLAHEIKTPLTTLRGYTENIQIVSSSSPQVNRYCGIMLEECDSLDLLAKEMMEASALDGGEHFYEMEWMDAGTLGEQVRQRILREYPDVSIVVEWEDGSIFANAYLLERVIFNYLGNAVKYRAPDTEIQLNGRFAQGRFCIQVTNAGEAIPAEEQQRIWEPFYKRDKSRRRSSGYGLGLYVVRQVAEMCQAEVGLRSQDGRNTFYFNLPIPTDLPPVL